MTKTRYGEKTKNTFFRWLYFVLFGLVAVWLLSSIFTKKSPADVLRSVFSKIPNSTSFTCEDLLIQKDSIIHSLELQLSKSTGTKSSGRAMVLIESQTLNMRTKPNLNSSIIIKIPANSEVEIMYYDSKTFYLEDKPGKWCKVRYGSSEGWVWGNYIKEF